MPNGTSRATVILSMTRLDDPKYAPLSRQAERQLFDRYRATGDPVLRHQIVEHNLRFVCLIAQEYAQTLELDELIDVGVLGLDEAIDRFNPATGHKFITYAVWWVRQAIQSELTPLTRSVRLPYSHLERHRRLAKALNQAESLPAACLEAGFTLEEGNVLLQDHQGPLSLDALLGHEPGRPQTFMELLVDDEPGTEVQLASQTQTEVLMGALAQLTETRLAQIIRWYWGLDGEPPQTLEVIGRRMGMTRERIRQLKVKALDQLRRDPQVRLLLDEDSE